MHFSHALIAVLSLSASQAVAAPVVQQYDSHAIVSRGAADAEILSRSLNNMVEKRSMTSQQAQESRQIFARYAHIANDRERSVAVVRDLSKRGVLDTLVAAIAQIINEILGTASAPAMRRRQSGPIITYTNDLISSAVCLLESLLGVSTTGCTSTPAATRRGLNAQSMATQDSLSKMLTMIGKILEEKGESLSTNNATSTAAANTTGTAATAAVKGGASNSTAAALPATKGAKGSKAKDTKSKSSAAEKRDVLTARQTEGVQGLLEVLRELSDAILNTLLPMSSRGESSPSTTSSAAHATGKNCPPPGTPNDGMYRPGCPGYGRRDLGNAPTLSARDTNMLQSMLPMLQMLMEELPSLLSGNSSSSSGSDSLSSLLTGTSSSATIPSTTNAAAVTAAAGSAADGITTATATSSAKKAKSTGVKNAPISAAKLSIDTRDLLEADGFQRRQTAATDGGDDSNGGSSQSGNTGGANVSILNNLLNGLLGNLLGSNGGGGGLKTHDLGDNNNGTSQDGNSGGLNVSILDNLLNGLLGGLLGTSSKRDILLNNVLGSKHLKRAAVTYATRSLLNVRADFQPVWEEVKKLGNEHFHTRSTSQNQDLIARDELTPVWTSFRDMMDSAYNEEKSSQGGKQRRSPLPKVDTSAFVHASSQFLKQKAFGKRDADLQPLKAAATAFAKNQMHEWTDKLNAKAH